MGWLPWQRPGFDLGIQLEEAAARTAGSPPPGRADNCLTIHGERMGYRDLHLEVESSQARDELLDGLRILRCNTSELFKQRLDEMFDKGMR